MGRRAGSSCFSANSGAAGAMRPRRARAADRICGKDTCNRATAWEGVKASPGGAGASTGRAVADVITLAFRLTGGSVSGHTRVARAAYAGRRPAWRQGAGKRAAARRQQQDDRGSKQ
ncbi:hypothetical protein PSAC2689_140078 [Paraburkholderia sacchari]